MIKTFAKRLLISCVIIICVWASGLAWFGLSIATTPASDATRTDAIIVLTGGKGRIDYGLSLLTKEYADKLLISGVNDESTPIDLVEKIIQHSPQAHQLYRSGKIELGFRATSTIGNALEVKEWVEKRECKSIRLVTANYHMPRAFSELKETIPTITIIADPVVSDNFTLADWWKFDTSWKLLLGEYHKYLASRLRHFVIAYTQKT